MKYAVWIVLGLILVGLGLFTLYFFAMAGLPF